MDRYMMNEFKYSKNSTNSNLFQDGIVETKIKKIGAFMSSLSYYFTHFKVKQFNYFIGNKLFYQKNIT